MNKKLFITGVKHCGKSTIGKNLSKIKDIPFYDLDDLIEESVNMGVREFYKKEGRDRFLEEESKAINFLSREVNHPFICSTGGGICDNSSIFSELNSIGLVVFIDEKFDVIFKRVSLGGIPAFLKTDDPESEFKELYNKRSKKYREAADIVVNANKKTPNEITYELEKELDNVW